MPDGTPWFARRDPYLLPLALRAIVGWLNIDFSHQATPGLRRSVDDDCQAGPRLSPLAILSIAIQRPVTSPSLPSRNKEFPR